MLDRLGLASEFKGGLRVTTPEVDGRRADGAHRPGRAASSSACSTSTGRSPSASPVRTRPLRRAPPRRRRRRRGGDIGLVGDVVEVDPAAVLDLLDAGRIPVVSTIAPDLDDDGQVLNVNADTAAAALAVALGRPQARRPHRRRGRLRRAGRTGPRCCPSCASPAATSCCPRRRRGDDPQARGVHPRRRGRGPAGARRRRPPAAHLLLEVFTSEGIGTMVLPDDETGARMSDPSTTTPARERRWLDRYEGVAAQPLRPPAARARAR